MATQTLADMFRLDGKTTIVTGGAKGIGKGIAARFVEAGAAVEIVDLDEEAGARTAGEIGAGFIRADLGVETDAERVIASTLSNHGRVDILVNNAGIYPFKPTLEMTAEEWDRVQDVNLRGLFLLSREFARSLRDAGHGGAVVNIGSIDSFHPSSPGLAAYDASKGGVLMFTRSFALEVAHLGIRVNMIAPGAVATEGTAAVQTDEAFAREFVARVPMGRWGLPDEIATMAIVLATPLSSYMTGAAVVVDGGRLLG